MKKFQLLILTALTATAMSPYAVPANELKPSASPHPVQGNNFGVITSYACGSGSATYMSGPGKAGYLLKNTNHTYGCQGTPTGGGAGVNYFTENVTLIPFSNMSFSLRNGKNGTVNVYLITQNAPYPTYSVSFSNLQGADFTVSPAQFNPPVAVGTQVLGVVLDANPCQQVTIKNVAINGTPGVLQVHGGTSCPVFITCQQPN
ncbi:MAG: hypothetical protein JST44_18165 [Cyanobacteria bacterium SZAS LIN-5]|nr:hypothetical protein [Cyanobacteria bacterium SZAS LIN-5]